MKAMIIGFGIADQLNKSSYMIGMFDGKKTTIREAGVLESILCVDALRRSVIPQIRRRRFPVLIALDSAPTMVKAKRSRSLGRPWVVNEDLEERRNAVGAAALKIIRERLGLKVPIQRARRISGVAAVEAEELAIKYVDPARSLDGAIRGASSYLNVIPEAVNAFRSAAAATDLIRGSNEDL